MSHCTVMATRANPDRAKEAGMGPGAFQVSHWVPGEDGVPVNAHKLDAWLPSMEAAVQWVAHKYPHATVSKVRNDAAGAKVVVSYLVPMTDLASS